ncbi:hypothetical protein ABEV54_14325 [Peribacillus psychrosaccharolyticus]
MELVIGKKTNNEAANNLIRALKEFESNDSILYFGYPILATADENFS